MFVPLALALLTSPFQEHDIQASPFDGLRWEGGEPEVRIEDDWYRPTAIDAISIDALLATIDGRWPGQREKRFAEDLVEAMVLMDWDGDLFVDLDLVRLADQAPTRLEGVEMTRDKRQALRDARNASAPRREAPPAVAFLDREGLAADVRAFREGLERRFAYLGWRDVDLEEELEAIEGRLAQDDAVSMVALADALHRLLMRFSDGHANVRPPGRLGRYEGAHLPFLLGATGDGVCAFDPDRRGLLDPDFPYVVALDGLPLADWTAAAAPSVVQGSPQAVERRCLRALREFDGLRAELGREVTETVVLTLGAARGRKTRDLELRLQSARPIYGPWPRSASRRIGDDIGYLRIPAMDDDVQSVRAAMESFRDADGLIVDVRGNGGGSREILLALAGYLIGPNDDPVVANIAAYRDGGDFGTDHLEARFMHVDDWDGWSSEQRKAIRRAARRFRPEWKPEQPMSAWHYLVLDRTGHADEYHFDAPVVVLSDAGCFSATDIFLAGLELLDDVTLMGSASSGGSARTQRFRLPTSGIEVSCASMASFRPNGRLYDGRGVEVDVELLPEPSDFLVDGTDTVLAAALERLRSGR